MIKLTKRTKTKCNKAMTKESMLDAAKNSGAIFLTKCFHVAVRLQYHATFYCRKPEIATGRLWIARLDFFARLGCQITD